MIFLWGIQLLKHQKLIKQKLFWWKCRKTFFKKKKHLLRKVENEADGKIEIWTGSNRLLMTTR